MANHRRRRVQDIVEESKHWEAEDLLRNLEEEMQRLEQGLGHVMFDAEGLPVTMCVSPLPLAPRFETKELKDEFALRVNLPEVKKEDVRVYVDKDSVEVHAVSSRKICRPFYLSVATPWSVDSDHALVKFENGVLTVRTKRLKKKRVHVK